MPQKRKRPTSKKAQNTKSAPTRRGASSVVQVAPSMSGKLRVVSDDRNLEQETFYQSEDTIQSEESAAQKSNANNSFGFNGLFNPDDVADEEAYKSTRQSENASPFANQDASEFSRSSDTYSTHKKHATHNSSSHSRRPAKRSDSLSKARVRGSDESYASPSFNVDDMVETSNQCMEPNKPRTDSRKKKPHKWTVARVVMLLIAMLMIAGLAVGGLFFWDRFLRYDDATDFQGTWYFQEGSVEVTVDESYIHLPEDLNYAYTLDTWAKTISLSFADLTGGGSYEFSEDRTSITIYEGEGSNATSLTLVRALQPISEGTTVDASVGESKSGSDSYEVDTNISKTTSSDAQKAESIDND